MFKCSSMLMVRSCAWLSLQEWTCLVISLDGKADDLTLVCFLSSLDSGSFGTPVMIVALRVVAGERKESSSEALRAVKQVSWHMPGVWTEGVSTISM